MAGFAIESMLYAAGICSHFGKDSDCLSTIECSQRLRSECIATSLPNHSQAHTTLLEKAYCGDYLYEELRPLPLQPVVIAQFPDCPDHIVCKLHALLDLPILPRLLRLWVWLHHDGGGVGAMPILCCVTAV